MFFVFSREDATQPAGLIVVVGRAINETKYTWSAGTGDDAPNGVEGSESAAVSAIFAARG